MSYVIDRLDDFGRGITKVNGKTCFVNNALDEEEVDIDIISEKKNYCSGNQTKIIKETKFRKSPECSYYFDCGGCNIMHMKYPKQLMFKEEKVRKILKKFSNIENVVDSIIPSKEFIYRNKVNLKVKDGHLGFFKEKTYEIVKINKCLLCRGIINEVIKILSKLNLNGIDEILIRSNYKDEVLLCLYGNDIDKDYFLEYLYKVDNIVIIDNKIKTIVKGNDYFIDKIDNMLFRVSLESFFQVNAFQVSNLYKKVLEYADLTGKENVLDLYCGTGTIGMFLSKKAKYVYGIEINENAINDANYNKGLNKVDNIEFICSDVGVVKKKYKNIDLVVVDPPRSGLSSDSIKNILDINSKKIIYVSCDSVTLARDLNILKDYYEIKHVTPVDMFPNTYHVETVSVLCRKTIE